LKDIAIPMLTTEGKLKEFEGIEVI